MARAAVPVLLLVLAAGCAAPSAVGRLRRHAVPGVWAGAAAGELEDATQWGPAAALLAALPPTLARDRSMQERLVDHPVLSEHTALGKAVAVGLGAVSAGIALADLLGGDEGRTLEVFLESHLLTEAAIAPMKAASHRASPGRPDEPWPYPSSHAAFAFAAATCVSRRLSGETGIAPILGYGLYLPALAVAVNRVETGRHQPSDVVVGAFLGTVISNLVWNAHHGVGPDGGIFGGGVPVRPVVGVDWIGLELALGF